MEKFLLPSNAVQKVTIVGDLSLSLSHSHYKAMEVCQFAMSCNKRVWAYDHCDGDGDGDGHALFSVSIVVHNV